MVYRILIDEVEGEWDEETRDYRYRGVGLRGAASGLGHVMSELGLPAPEIHNRRARFYFTEYGWDEIGRRLATKRGGVDTSFKLSVTRTPGGLRSSSGMPIK